MRSILEACQPRADILTGVFNPEIFTASLNQVLRAYRGEHTDSHAIYTQAKPFFREATYPTDGLRMVLTEVFGRLRGDSSYPAIHRLETGFGGGKTHTLIALTHLAHRGRELAEMVREVMPSALLPEPGAITVVGVAGDVVPVHQSKGTTLLPHTLWGEIARQTGGEALYREVEPIATSRAAPDEGFLEQLFAGRQVLIMLDELAQYAARLSAAYPGGAEQLAAFLMALLGYARTHAGISIVLTLASQADAFADHSARLSKLLSDIQGRDLQADEATDIAERARHEVLSVVNRDATAVVPVQSAEISRVLARRLFERIDEQAARSTADAYMTLYSRSAADLPVDANREEYRDTLAAHYPFHPRFIRFLTANLSQVESFQGTRGVLRVLALAVRRLWELKMAIPMIHTCHLDLRYERIVNEIMGRTGNNDLIPVLEADVGGIGTSTLETGMSVAESLDRKNPHPAGHRLYEWTWKTVFLHSLVGRAEGLGSERFGILRQDALLEVAMPDMPPVQIAKALEAIRDEAYYLREHNGRYYADPAPTINRILQQIRRGLSPAQIHEKLAAVARELVKGGTGSFQVVADVGAPEHIPDGKDRPVLAIIGLGENEIDAEAMVTSAGENRPRLQQNHVFLLVPEMVKVRSEVWNEDRVIRARERMERLKDLASRVLAIQRLRAHPEIYGIRPAMLADQDFTQQEKTRPHELNTAVTQAYNTLWYPGSSGQVVRRVIRTGGGEGGASIIEEVRRILLEEGELITADNATTRETVIGVGQLFFQLGATPSLKRIREAFAQRRTWPVLDQNSVLGQLIRAGVEQGQWCLFRMGGAENIRPQEFLSRETGLPLSLDLEQEGWSIITPQGARQRGWGEPERVDPVRLEQWVMESMIRQPEAPVYEVHRKLQAEHGEVAERDILEALDRLVQKDRLMAYHTPPAAPDGAPTDLIHGREALYQRVRSEDFIITPAEASQRGWVQVERHDHRLVLDGQEFTERLLSLLPRLGSLFGRGGKTHVDMLELLDLPLNGGGRLRLVLEDVPPEAMRRLGELFETLAVCTRADKDAHAVLEVEDPDPSCPFLKAVNPHESQ